MQKLLYTYAYKRIIEKTLSERRHYKIEANEKSEKILQKVVDIKNWIVVWLQSMRRREFAYYIVIEHALIFENWTDVQTQNVNLFLQKPDNYFELE